VEDIEFKFSLEENFVAVVQRQCCSF